MNYDIVKDKAGYSERERKYLLRKSKRILYCCTLRCDCSKCCVTFKCLYPRLISYLKKYAKAEHKLIEKLQEIWLCCKICFCKNCCEQFKAVYSELVKCLKMCPCPACCKGEKGDKGDRGPQGKQGPQGPTGPAGKDGVDGKDGAEGPAGKDGIDGKDGAEGPQGPTGPAGDAYGGVRIVTPIDGDTLYPGDKIAGMGTPGCTVSVSIDGGAPVDVTVASNGRWSVEPTVFISQTEHEVSAIQICPYEDPSNDSVYFHTLPNCPLPTIIYPIEGSIVTSNPLIVSGTAVPGSTLMVCVANSTEASLCQNVTVDSNGSWTVILSVYLRSDDYTATVWQDSATCSPNKASVSFSMETPSLEPDPVIELVYYETGKTFRTLDMKISAAGTPGTMTIHYLLLVPGMPSPTANEIINYDNEEALTTKMAVRGLFTANVDSYPQEYAYTLEGKEGITNPYPLELGVMDGYNYNLYVACQSNTGSVSNVISGGMLRMGLPFASGEGSDASPYVVRMLTSAEMAKYPDLVAGHPFNLAGVTENARILDNIEGMEVLYDESVGAHGLKNSLALSYKSEGDFELLNYDAAYGGQGWRPIGNVDHDPLVSGHHIFTGKFDTGAGTSVSGLRIHAKETPSSPAHVRGLFGQSFNVDFKNIILTDTQIDILLSGGTAANNSVGALVGFALGGVLDNIEIGSVKIEVSKGNLQTAPGYAGGIAGVLEGCQGVSNIVIGSVEITEKTADTTMSGGIAALFNQTNPEANVINIEIGSAVLSGSQNVGGVFGTVDAGISHIENVKIETVAIEAYASRSGGFTSTLNSGSPITVTGVQVSNIQSNHIMQSAGVSGGLFGFIDLSADFSVTDCHVFGGRINSGRYAGGIIGDMVTTANVTFNGLTSSADVATAESGTSGGLICQLRCEGADISASINNCTVGKATITGGSGFAQLLYFNSEQLGVISDCVTQATVVSGSCGFVSSTRGSIFTRCKALGDVEGHAGFVGNCTSSNSAEKNPAFVLCQARGNIRASGDTAGGFAGSSSERAVFDRCLTTGSVDAENASGFITSPAGEVIDCYATGDVVSLTASASGFAGRPGGTLNRCYSSGSIFGVSATCGMLLYGPNFYNPASVSSCIALNPVISTNSNATPYDRPQRVAATKLPVPINLTLSQNYARSDMILTRAGIAQPAVSDPNGLDGQSMNVADLESTMTALGWDTVNVWDASTIPTLGRPTLKENPEY